MAKEPEYFREILQFLLDRFGKPNINAKEYAEYLQRDVARVRSGIRSHDLPGRIIKGDNRDEYVIPVASIAMFEVKSSNV